MNAVDAAEEWLQGGQTATMLITSSLQYPDATDPSYVTETGNLLRGMTQLEMAVTMTWLARIAGLAILDKHHGSREMTEEEIQAMAVVLAEAQHSLIGDDV